MYDAQPALAPDSSGIRPAEDTQDAQIAPAPAPNAAAQAAEPAAAEVEPAAPEAEPALPFRSDTLLGVCEALGEDFGFNPLYLRVALASLVLVSTSLAIGLYLALGVAVLLSRLLAPKPRVAPAARPAMQRPEAREAAQAPAAEPPLSLAA